VSDGDTITVLTATTSSRESDYKASTPPRRASLWQCVRRHLASLVHGTTVVVEWHKRDKYDRLVGKVVMEGLDVQLAQLAEGLAWVYVKYIGESSPEDRDRYMAAEQQARAGRRRCHRGSGASVWQRPYPTTRSFPTARSFPPRPRARATRPILPSASHRHRPILTVLRYRSDGFSFFRRTRTASTGTETA
jgi:endonuclease YncB( thermonuclease family)